MNTLKLLKKTWGRRRFIKSGPIADLLAWEVDALLLKEFVLTKTNLQVVGSKVIIEMRAQLAAVMIEVLGLPVANVSIIDLEGSDVLIHSYGDSVFEADFKTLLSKAREIQQKSPHLLEDFFHIVLDNHKIALHFFMQKDYIHASTSEGVANY